MFKLRIYRYGQLYDTLTAYNAASLQKYLELINNEYALIKNVVQFKLTLNNVEVK